MTPFQYSSHIHDIESYLGVDNMLAKCDVLFQTHTSHLAIMLWWISGNLFHIGWNANYSLWTVNPIATGPIGHGIWDPHFALSIGSPYSCKQSDYTVIISYSGIYNWVYTVGLTDSRDVLILTLVAQLLAVTIIPTNMMH